MIKYILIFAFLLFAITSFSQAFIRHSNYKYLTADEVFNEVTTAFGSSLAPPIFEINNKDNTQKYIASYIPGSENLIIIDEELYDLAVTFGNDSLNALAAIISHELAHHYQRHNFCSDFAFILGKGNSLAKRITKIDKDIKEKTESEADYYGLFYGYVAGFNTINTFPSLLDKIYNYYKLPDKIAGYPSKNERKDIAYSSAKKLEEWVGIFDAGELLFTLKKYDEAFICFDKLSQVFPSREIYNNAGVIRLYKAIDILSSDQIPFILPIEFDAESRLKRGSVRDIEDNENKVKRIILSAIVYFEKANQIDPDYRNGQINLGCAYMLLKNYNLAIGISEKMLINMQANNDVKTLSRIYTLRGLGYYYLGDVKNAKKDIVKAKNLDNSNITSYNALLLDKVQEGPIDQFYSQLTSLFASHKEISDQSSSSIILDEKIGQIKANALTIQNLGHKISIENEANALSVNYLNRSSYREMAIASTEVHLNVICTQFGYTGKTSRGIGLYDPESVLIKAYKEPTYIIESMTGKYLIYRKSKIVFFVDKTHKIRKWWIYQFN